MARRKVIGPVLIYVECLTCGETLAPANSRDQVFQTLHGPAHYCSEWVADVVGHYSDQTMRLFHYDNTGD